MRKHVLSHVCNLGIDSAGTAASSSRVQSGHVLRSSLLPSANDIAGKFDSPISLHAGMSRTHCFARALKSSDTWTAGGTDTVHRNNVLAGWFASHDERSRPDYLGSYIYDECIHRLR